MATIGQKKDVETSLLRDLTTTESQYVDRWLARAESLIRVRIQDLQVRAESNVAYREVVADIEGEMVARVFRNPGGYKQEDEGNYSYRLDAAVASGLLKVSDDEWGLLIGKSALESAAGAMDGYAARRYGCARPDLQLQFGWPGHGGAR